VIAVDTSIVVPALTPEHEFHEPAANLVDQHAPQLPAHVALETYASLTAMPRHRRAPAQVAEALERSFEPPWLTLSAAGYVAVVRMVAEARMLSGAVFDALVAATAREHGARLYSRDERAARTYRVVGVEFELL
jgi:predicted nucleic acid-binding protein